MESKDISQLAANPKNPRTMSKHDAEALQNSIDLFGDLSGIVYNVQSKQLVGGHQRIETMKKIMPNAKIEMLEPYPLEKDDVGTVGIGFVLLGTKRYAYREVDWPADVEAAANIAANRIQGEFDIDLLAEMNYWLKENNPELLRATGQTDEEISRLLDSVSGDENTTLTDDDDAPDIDTAEPPLSQPGEVYQLGKHRLMCGDSTSDADCGLLMNGQIASMVFTDPPYNIGYEGGGGAKREGIMNDKMSGANFKVFLEAVCKNLHKYNTGAEYIFMSSAELDTLKQAFVSTGGHFQNYLIWVKNQFTLSGSDYQHKYEPIVYGWPKGIVNHYYVGDRDNANVWKDLRTSESATFDGEYTTIQVGKYIIRVKGQAEGEVRDQEAKLDTWYFDRPTKSEEHPTMKPIALCEEAVLNSSLRDQIVLDLFGGSGSTLIAAERQGRTCYMMELDPKYCDVIRKRYAIHVGKENDWQNETPKIENPTEAPAAIEAAAAVQPASIV